MLTFDVDIRFSATKGDAKTSRKLTLSDTFPHAWIVIGWLEFASFVARTNPERDMRGPERESNK